MQTGSFQPTAGDSSISQTFTAQPDAVGIQLFVYPVCGELLGIHTNDWVTATLTDNTAGTTGTLLAPMCVNYGNTNDQPWIPVTGPVTPGHSYTLTMASHDDNAPGTATTAFWDDVTVLSATPDFSVTLSTASLSAPAGGSATATVTTAVTTGAAPSLTFSVGGLPANTFANFVPGTVTAGGSSTFTINLPNGTPSGTYPLTFLGLSANGSHQAPLVLTVQ
jgi:hypothetical protein